MLKVKNCTVHYGGSVAVRGIDLSVSSGECLGIIGPNGAGKSSLLKSLMGLVGSGEGIIQLEDGDVTVLPTEKRVRAGMALVPEGRGVLSTLTVADNLRLGLYSLPPDRRTPQQVKGLYEYIFHLFPRLRERLSQIARTLSGGEQQMLVIGRALMSRPKLLLLDEPLLGLSPQLGMGVIDTLLALKQKGLTMIVVEQNVPLIKDLCDRIMVMIQGRIVLSGSAAEIAQTDLRKVYFEGASTVVDSTL